MAIDKIKVNSLGTTGTASSSNFLRGDMAWTAIAGDIEGVTAGTGLNGGGTSGTVTLNVDTTLNSVTSMTSLVTVGTIGTGVWQGTAVADGYLGTGINATKLADGTVTNAELQYINTLSSNAQTQITNTVTVANAALPKAGGTMSGETVFADQLATRAQMKDYAETVNAIGSITAGTNADLTNGNVQSVTMTANTFNFGFTNALASHSNSMTLIITNGGLATVTWLSGAHDGGGNVVQWGAGNAPTLTNSGTDILTFVTFNGGTNWYGFPSGTAFATP